MDGDPTSAPGVTAASGPATSDAARSIVDSIETLWASSRALIADQLELVALEGQRAGGNLLGILIYGAAIGVLGASVWMGLIGAVALVLVDIGLIAAVALLGVSLFNLLAIYGLARVIRRRSRELRFPASLTALRAGTTPGPRP
jgi:uncharacterized membrane protein YqjE